MNTNDKGSHVLKKLLFSGERAFLLFVFAFLSLILAACGRGQAPAVDTATEPAGGATETDAAATAAALPDGVYSADFKTDGSMFHVNEADHGKGVLTVENGQMTIHISLPSKNSI